MKSNDKNHRENEKYQLLTPEGGWGYMIAIALTISFTATFIPMSSFGLIFGKFLAGIGDETTGTTLANGIFNACFNITGLAANSLLQKYTYRVVALIGSLLFFLGSFTTIFVTNLPQMVISFGIIQGLGMGLVVPASFTALNSYFDKKLNLMNSVAQAVMVAASMVFPYVGQYLMTTYGFRGTVAILSAVGVHAFLAAALLQPVERHYKKVKLSLENQDLLIDKRLVLPKPRSSIISIGDRAVSVTTINRFEKIQNANKTWWQSLAKSMDLGMFKDPVYVNIVVGLALGFTADVAFVSILPLVLMNAGFDSARTAFLVAVYFASDLTARILLSVISALCNLKNRYLFLGGSLLLVIFRTAFVMRDDFYWKVITVSAVGFLRCFIQTPLPAVISEQYSNNFATAYSLYMVVCGVVSLIFGPLMSFVKTSTQSDVMVVHLLSLAYLACVVSWSVELFYIKIRRSK